jgi:hypothetical protein
MSTRNPNMPVSAADLREQVNAIQRLMDAVMKEGEHYGRVPGSRKPSLWKPGAEKLCLAFQIAASFIVEDLSGPDRYRYRVKCVGTHRESAVTLGEGMGACSSMEQRYKWRRAWDAEFDATPDERRRFKYGYDAEARRPYEIRQVRAEHDDLENVILKMACKRSLVAMVLNVTAASDIFTQDIEDMPEHLREETAEASGNTVIAQPRPKSASQDRKSPGPSPESAVVQPESKAERPALPLLSAGQRRVLRARLANAKLSEEDLTKKFGSALEAIPLSKFNEVTAWLRESTQHHA